MESVPEELAGLKPFIVRSEEMKTADPIISYYCFRYAVSLAMEYRKQDPSNQSITSYLTNMLSTLESKKQQIGEVQDPKSHYEKFLTMLFVSADNDDRKVGSTKKTAQKFLILSYFIEAFNVFEELPPDWEEKRVYCKWKTADILKAIKKGEKPQPGGPNERSENPEENKQANPDFGSPAVYRPSYNPASDFSQPNPNPPSSDFNPPKPAQPGFQATPKPPENTGGRSGFSNSSSQPADPPTRVPPSQPSLVPAKAPQPEIRQSTRPSKAALTAEQRKILDQAKKFGQNGVQELEYKNIQQAIAAFQNAIRALENFNS